MGRRKVNMKKVNMIIDVPPNERKFLPKIKKDLSKYNVTSKSTDIPDHTRIVAKFKDSTEAEEFAAIWWNDVYIKADYWSSLDK
jgi:hypothetical protein